MQRGFTYRLLAMLWLALGGALLTSGYFALRALVGGHTLDASAAVVGGALAGAVIGGAVGAVYLVLGGLLRLDGWSMGIGALLGAGLLGAVQVGAVYFGVTTATDLRRLALLGALDGLLTGALVGVGVSFVSAQPVRLTASGCLRYAVLFMGLVVGAGTLMLIGAGGGWRGLLAVGMGIVGLVMLRALVRRREDSGENVTESDATWGELTAADQDWGES